MRRNPARGASGTIDPTEYSYSGTTGLLTKVTYTAGGSAYDAEYEYDGNARRVGGSGKCKMVEGSGCVQDRAPAFPIRVNGCPFAVQ